MKRLQAVLSKIIKLFQICKKELCQSYTEKPQAILSNVIRLYQSWVEKLQAAEDKFTKLYRSETEKLYPSYKGEL